MRERTIVIRVDIPSLDALVAYLSGKEFKALQAQIDAKTAAIEDLTKRLKQSGTELEDAVQDTNQ